MRFPALALSLVAAVSSPAAAQDQCDVLVLTGIDVSSSVKAEGVVLQLEGMAKALTAPQVVSAMTHGPHGCIGFAVFLWADGDYPALIDWRVIASQEGAEAAAAEMLAATGQVIADAQKTTGTLTNVSGALDHAAQMLTAAPIPAARHVVNVISDGEDNVGEDPLRARADLLAAGATINAVVMGPAPEVEAY